MPYHIKTTLNKKIMSYINSSCITVAIICLSIFGVIDSYAESNKQPIKHELHFHDKLSNKHFANSPMQQYQRWLKSAEKHGVYNTYAATLITIDQDSYPTGRTVGIKKITEKGFVFFTNPESPKAKHFLKDPKVSMVVVWHDKKMKQSYQIRMKGSVAKYNEPNQHLVHHDKNQVRLKWQGFIVIPKDVQFSLQRIIKKMGIVEYVTYAQKDGEWKHQMREKYFAPGGC
jgi:pyridoxine/pyridoxamine 5'-phosphate oxidase